MIFKDPSLKASNRRKEARGTNLHGNRNQKPVGSAIYNWQGLNHRKWAAFPREQTPRLSPYADRQGPKVRRWERISKERAN
jgi:hypothetical protein